MTYLGLQISLLVLCTIDKVHQTRAATSAAVVRVLTAMMIVILSRMEHSRSIRPSLVLNTYLFFSLLFDITQARTLYLLQDDASKASVFSSTLGIKVVLLLLEAQGKTSYLREPYRNLSPETTSGIWSQSSFWWLNDLIITGFWKLLSINDLYELDVELRSEKLCEAMHIAWDKRGM